MDTTEKRPIVQQAVDMKLVANEVPTIPNHSSNSSFQLITDNSDMIKRKNSTQKVYDNVIVGGGPGGINMALEFTVRHIPYILLERSSNFGGQFRHLPRCGELISLNKKHLPGKNPGWMYARRYDWHTLSSITEEDSEKDPMLLFTNWSDDLFPKAKRLVEYLDYVGNHPNWHVVDHSRFNCQVSCITKDDSNVFLIKTTGDEIFMARRVFMGTGASRPVVPDIHGIREHATFYPDFDSFDIERYRKKSIVILGSGNSAFEVAHSLQAVAGDIIVLTRSGVKFARQTHNVHDVRTQTSTIYDLAQLKSLVTIVGGCCKEMKRMEDGRILLKCVVSEPIWEKPIWRHGYLMADHVIACCGFEYTVPDVFTTKRVRPQADPTNKFCVLTSTWESINVPNLYFIGGSMRINDRDAASGFIHGFRYNIQALGSVIAERHYDQPLVPIFQCVLDPKRDDTFEPLTQFVIQMVSSTAALFELFNYGCSTITFQAVSESNNATTLKYKAEVWEVLPKEYARQRWAGNRIWTGRVEIVFQYGFHLFGENIATHHFTHLADKFHPERSTYIHPVFHAFHHGSEKMSKFPDSPGKVGEQHLNENLLARWDKIHWEEEGCNVHQYTNTVYNAVADALGMPNRKSVLPVHDDFIDRLYPPITSDEVEQVLQREPGLRQIFEAKAKKKTSTVANNSKTCNVL